MNDACNFFGSFAAYSRLQGDFRKQSAQTKQCFALLFMKFMNASEETFADSMLFFTFPKIGEKLLHA